MSRRNATQQQQDPRETRAHEREWVVVTTNAGRGRPAHQSGRLVLEAAEQRRDELAAKLRAQGSADVAGVAWRPSRERQPHTRRYRCRRCSAVKQVKPPGPRTCAECGSNQHMLAERSSKAVA